MFREMLCDMYSSYFLFVFAFTIAKSCTLSNAFVPPPFLHEDVMLDDDFDIIGRTASDVFAHYTLPEIDDPPIFAMSSEDVPHGKQIRESIIKLP